MVFAVYTDEEGYIGEVSAPDRQTAIDFLETKGYHYETYKLCERYPED